MKKSPSFVPFVAVAVAFFAAASASADTLLWRGKGDTTRFSEPMNWSSSDGSHAIPQNGDTISFANITTGISITNDIENLRLASIVDNLNYAVWINGKLEAGAVNSPGSAFLIAAGASGALLKNVPNGEIVAAIRRIAAGKRVVSPDIELMLENDPPVPDLSPRQREILESITRGLTNAQIALQFDISPESVKTYIARLFEKLGAASRSEAVSIALRRHLLKI